MDGDVLVVTQKVVSKAEGRLVAIDADDPDGQAGTGRAESVRIVRRRGELLITETRHGFICANAGVDLSNVERRNRRPPARRPRPVGPTDPGGTSCTAPASRWGWSSRTPSAARGAGASPMWPSACAGVAGVVDLRGTADASGRVLDATEVCVADELAGAAELVMGKDRGIPAAVVRGVDPRWFRPASVADRDHPPSGRGPVPLMVRRPSGPGGRTGGRTGRPDQPTSKRSTTKTSVSFGAMAPPAPASP